jgi:hypothetical protein
MEAIKNIEYPPDFQKYFPPFEGEIPESYFYRDDPLTEENIAHMKTAPGAILDVMGPSRFIDRNDFVEDMRFHQNLFKSSSSSDFLGTNEFEDYLYEAYGKIYYSDFWDVIYNELEFKEKVKN